MHKPLSDTSRETWRKRLLPIRPRLSPTGVMVTGATVAETFNRLYYFERAAETYIRALQTGTPPDMDVYDAAAWSCITPLSEWSIANGSRPIDIPDFTRGAWKTNKPLDVTLNGGGTTGVRNLKDADSKGQLNVH